jgi:hypothetical protein
VFDGGCRPAELFLALAGGWDRPAAYKVGLFGCLLLVPLAFVLAGRGAGLPAGAAVLAGAVGTVLGWSWPVRRLIEEGEFDFLMAGLGVIVFVCWLARYARWFGVDSWLVLAAVAAAGWYAHPVVWVGLGPVLVGYYLVVAPRQELAWHLGLLGITAAGLAPNLWWLTDWARYWWLRQPTPDDPLSLPGLHTILGSPGDYLTLAGYVPYGGLLLLGGVAGLVALWRAGCRGSAALLFVASLLTVAVARVLAAWTTIPTDAAERLAPLAAGFLALPAAFGLWKLFGRLQVAGFEIGLAVVALLLFGWADGPDRPLAARLRLHNEPLLIGLSTDQQEVVTALSEHTTAEARILWDETTDHRPGWNWTALLPVFTGRAYLGGLDPDAGMEFSFCGLRDGKLNGRPLGTWTDPDLEKFCRWYNVGWVVCRSPAAEDRWGKVPGAKPVAHLKEGGRRVVIIALGRKRSFALSGAAKLEEAVPNRITLTDVAPDADGKVDLSFHHCPGLRVYPSYIRIHRPEDTQPDTAPDPTSRDPMNHVRLRVPGPVPRVTLVWETP